MVNNRLEDPISKKMAKSQEIELFISDDGELKVHIKGMKGPGCIKVLDDISKEIGTQKEKTLSAEYYEKPQDKTQSDTRLKNK